MELGPDFSKNTILQVGQLTRRTGNAGIGRAAGRWEGLAAGCRGPPTCHSASFSPLTPICIYKSYRVN